MTTEEQLNAISQKYGINKSQPFPGGDDLSSLRAKLNPVSETTSKPTDIRTASGTLIVGGPAAEITTNVANRFKTAAKLQDEALSPDTGFGKGLTKQFQAGGQVAGAVGDIVGGAIMAIPGVKNAVERGGQAFMEATNLLGETNADTIKRFAPIVEKHPEAAKNIEALFNYIDVATLATGAGVAKDAGAKALEKAPALAGKASELASSAKSGISKAAGAVLPNEEKAIINLVSPELSAKKAGEAITSGRGAVNKGTIFDTVEITPDSKIMKAYDAVKDVAKADATVTENLNLVRGALSTEAEALKSKIADVPSIFTFKELNSKLKDIELPISFKNDKLQYKTLNDITNTAMEIAKKNGGKLDSLLDARKEFDSLVEENFPNLYENGKPTTAYNAITKTRGALNDFIESKLPDGFGYKESLRKQSSFYDAIDAMESKAAKEVGQPTNKAVRKVKELMKNNPKTTAILKGAGYTAVGAGTLKGLLGN